MTKVRPPPTLVQGSSASQMPSPSVSGVELTGRGAAAGRAVGRAVVALLAGLGHAVAADGLHDGLVGADVAVWALGPRHAALVGCRAEGIVTRVDRRAADTEREGCGGAGRVHLEGSQHGVAGREPGAARVVREVVGTAGHAGAVPAALFAMIVLRITVSVPSKMPPPACRRLTAEPAARFPRRCCWSR